MADSAGGGRETENLFGVALSLIFKQGNHAEVQFNFLH